MEFVYFDLGQKYDRNVVSNRDDVLFSPIVLWNKIVEESNAAKRILVVCEDCLRSEYETLCLVTHLQNVRVLPISQIQEGSRMKQTSILLSLYNQNVLSDKIVAVSPEPSIPPKGLHLDTLLDYMDFKKADSIGLCIRNSAVASLPVFREKLTLLGSNSNYMIYTNQLPFIMSMAYLSIQDVAQSNQAPTYITIPFLPILVHDQASLREAVKLYSDPANDLSQNPSSVIGECYARIGLIGNPSDGYYGNTISVSVENFCTHVSLVKSDHLEIIPHPINDPTRFDSIRNLHSHFQKNGYSGGVRLLSASINHFFKYVRERGIYINETPFTLSYDTTIPRQVGLSGSSSIVIATLRALLEFYRISTEEFSPLEQIKWALQVETEELGITAGLQDRVVQVLNGCISMNFDRDAIASTGNGIYERIDTSLLPPLFLAYAQAPKDISA
ncbi:hypothetical protein WA588_001207 [Blastocystis sp. NMH]